MRLWRLGVLFLLLVGALQTSACPESCSCLNSGYTFQCVQCLQTFYRYYDSISKSCPCMTGFLEKDPADTYCCPTNCSSCSDQGCVRCPVNFMQQYSTSLEVYVCICEDNYYYDESTNSCVCLSHTNSSLYYENVPTDRCQKCPLGCSCNANGCYQCTSSLRKVSMDYSGRWTCPCVMPYEDTYGGCTCYEGCNCTDFTCATNTHRQYKDGRFQCKTPYTELNGKCECVSPSMIDNRTTNIDNCVCSSRYYPTKYYSYGNECYRCVEGCICDQKGCIYCDANLNRLVQSYTCLCNPPNIMFNDSCNCSEPFYRSSDGTCKCLYYYNPLKYVYNATDKICYACPTGCSCNQSGCYRCGLGSLRVVTNVNGSYNCSCISYTEEVNNLCKCQPYSQLVNGQCVCYNSSTIYDDHGMCKPCPIGCTCGPGTGCISCNASSHRNVTASSTGYSTCPCGKGYKEDQTGVCICSYPYELDSSGTCICPTPDILQIGACICTSNFDPQGFYDNRLDNMCIACPIGCKCDANGCHDCQDHTLRYNVVINGYEECPCIQNSSYYNGYCTVCFNNSYYFSGKCVDCPLCLTCDTRGCTSCFTGAIWNSTEFTCTCADPAMLNYNGTCRCGPGVYMNSTTNTCVPCPNNCLDCITPTKCTSCRSGVHRYNSPATNCPCESDYIEMGATQIYCCPKTCKTCNETHCLECPIFSYRILSNGSCKCQNNLIEVNNSVVCGCPSRMYLFNSSCVECPLNCWTCTYNQISDKVMCTSCQSSMNRNQNPNIGCTCLDRFKESNPVLDFCFPAYCILPTRICEECEYPRIVQMDGLRCGCRSGYFLNTYGDCLECTMPGCLECTALNLCLHCNVSAGYYMTNYTCKSIVPPVDSNYLAIQHQQSIRVLLKTGVDLTRFNEVLSISVQMEPIISNPIPTDPIITPVVLNVLNYSLILPDVLLIEMSNPTIQLVNYLLAINFVLITHKLSGINSTWYGTDSHGPFLAVYSTAYIYKKFTYSDAELNLLSNTSSMLAFFFTGLFILIVLTLYVLGFKHNQTPFFLQSLSFIAFTFSDQDLVLIPFLYNLRFSWYRFNKNIFWLLPQGYYETSTGNFSLLTIDSNILRVGSIPLLMAILVMCLSLTLRLAYELYLRYMCVSNKKFVLFVKTAKKPTYRVLEFFYKTCMLPILFLSFIAMRNWNSEVIVGDNYFRNLCKGIAITALVTYTAVTLFQVCFESISKVYRIENAMEFLTSAAAAGIITYSPSNNLFLVLIVVYFLRGACYILSRVYYLRDFNNLQYMRVGTFVLESLTLFLILRNRLEVLAAMTFITVCYGIAHSIVVLVLTFRRAKRSKRKIGSKEETNESELDLQIESAEEIPDGMLPEDSQH